MLLGCLLGLGMWLTVTALVLWLGWPGALLVIAASIVVFSHWLAPDRPWE